MKQYILSKCIGVTHQCWTLLNVVLRNQVQPDLCLLSVVIQEVLYYFSSSMVACYIMLLFILAFMDVAAEHVSCVSCVSASKFNQNCQLVNMFLMENSKPETSTTVIHPVLIEDSVSINFQAVFTTRIEVCLQKVTDFVVTFCLGLILIDVLT